MIIQLILSLLSIGALIAYFIFIARFWFRSMKAYSSLVKYEYENLHEQWVKHGEPEGMVYWSAPQRSKNLLNRLIRSNPGFTMLPLVFYTPKWIASHPQAQAYLKDMRRNTLWWNIGAIGMIPVFMLIVLLSSLWVR
jgi:hypothetical protein